ncbi:hypothetical protein ANME2D_03453 [Candidatus Methanoperedens nitroreducens]|uniref:Uncharacterized protein n=1 Tax=Candidatus Methanoperedens nitratireducens TaxID=1392998 RepID=A0A062UYS8_9EURY|nr:hypothetical protein ANME2D_03453 [Candidatus Methanoperedens nitroreducens]
MPKVCVDLSEKGYEILAELKNDKINKKVNKYEKFGF